MRKKAATPDQISQALALREAGYTVLSISQRLGVSVRSLQRHFAAHGAKKGALKQELLDAAKAELLRRVTSDDAIREEAARLINDDLAHAHYLRTILMDAAEQLKANTLRDAVLVMRASAAYSTAIKNTSDMLRHTLRVDRVVEGSNEDMPELTVRELTKDEINALRAQGKLKQKEPPLEKDGIKLAD
jgi:AraC-like DNA-binding protein